MLPFVGRCSVSTKAQEKRS